MRSPSPTEVCVAENECGGEFDYRSSPKPSRRSQRKKDNATPPPSRKRSHAPEPISPSQTSSADTPPYISNKKKPLDLEARKINDVASELFQDVLPNECTTDELGLLVPLMKSMVATEATMLGADDLSVDRTKTRRVQFSGVDGSSIYPPVDREVGSDESLQEAIEALKSAKEVIQSLPKSAAPILEELVAYLKDSSIFHACAAAMSDYADYPVKRVETAAKLFVHDFEIVLDRIRGLPEDALTPLRRADAVNSEKPLKFIEENLAVRVGLAIRYYLRVLFNPSPPSITTIDAEREAAHLVTLSKYSGVCELIEFVDDDGEDHHGDVTCLSAYVSKSIQRVYEYLRDFHNNSPLLDGISAIELPEGFCTSQAAGMTIPTRGRDFPDEHFDSTQRDILEATYFIAASRSARFLVDLCGAPGVTDEIKRMGGWDSIQTYATMSWQHDLYRHCDADAHLVALSSFDTFLENLEELADRMDCRRVDAVKALERVKKNYRFSTTSQKILEAFPRITELKTICDERMELASNIPVIRPV